MIYSRIQGTGSYLPEKILTNADLEQLVDTSDEWIVERTGIRQRHIARADETAAIIGANAAQAAMAAAQLQPNDIDLIIVATSSAERIFPSTACLIQQLLNITNGCPSFDLAAACSGFNYALATADQFIRTGAVKHALVIGTEIMSRIVDWSDRTTCVLFGDGAGAVVLSAADKPGIISTHIHADGRFKDLLYTTDNAAAGQLETITAPCIKMTGSELFKQAVNQLGNIVTKTLEFNQLKPEAINWLIPHQANLRIISATAKKLNMSLEQVIITVGRHGNTSAASVPLALDTGIKDGRIKRGDTLLLESFGGGLTWGSALVVY